ncbi:hypothetical protein [Winogradskyella sp.]|uniref:hypothetical protein n=1 Tax=Winogradskyella sp. TaxID=1883156 RepID=UPI0025DE37B3|nr:hypothetical protein [Winogradskyella sp.]
MKKIAYIVSLVLLVSGCSDTRDQNPGNNDDVGSGEDPLTGVQLVFPYQDELCNEGTDLTPTESTVFFEWMPNDNAEIYTLTIENLETGTITEYETVDFIFSVTIERAQAFRWFVNYNFQEQPQESAIWNFYNAGSGVQTYAPFPAEILAPSMAQTIPATNTSVNLQWSGSDVDDDIVAYDVYFGTNNDPSIIANDISVNQQTVSVVSGTIYYWNVVTKDAEGNISESGVHQFSVL